MPSTQLTLNRSTSQPDTIWNGGYNQKKAERINPRWLGEIWNSALMAGAAAAKDVRSM